MEENLLIIEEICGLKPSETEFIIIKNDPNFVFTPNPNFGVKVLYDADENIINVSSWLECANYVNGGWSDIIPGTIVWEKNLMIIYIVITSAFLLFRKFKKTSSKL